MKRVILSTVVMASTLIFLSGCGSDNPESVVKNYVEAWNKGSVNQVVKYVDTETKKEIVTIMNDCILDNSNSILEKTLKKYKKEVKSTWRKHNPFMAIKTVKKPSKDFEEKMNKLSHDTSMTSNEKTLKIGMLLLDQVNAYKQVKSEMSPVAYKMLVFNFSNKLRAESGDIFGAVDNYDQKQYFKSLILADMKKNGSEQINKVKQICVEQIFHPNTLDKLNIIDTKKVAADRIDIKIELLYKNKSSKKKHIKVEKNMDKWQVETLL